MGLTAREADWVRHGERGMSSDALFQRLTGHELTQAPWFNANPRDPADFRRCQLMLEHCGLRDRLAEAADLSPSWARLIAAWHSILDTFEAETRAVDWRDRFGNWSAPLTYEAIQRAISGEA
jgi:hypothetical protein